MIAPSQTLIAQNFSSGGAYVLGIIAKIFIIRHNLVYQFRSGFAQDSIGASQAEQVLQ